MKSKKLLLFAVILTLMTGCARPGPMQTPNGLLHTKAFEPIFLHTINNGSKTILFKEYTTMYEHKSLQSWGVFTITEQGVYFAVWDTTSFEYNILFKLDKNEIANINEDLIERNMWIDSELLTITDKNGKEVGFALNGKRAAYTIIDRLLKDKL